MDYHELPKMVVDLAERVKVLEARLSQKESKPTYLDYEQAAEVLGLSVSRVRVLKSENKLRPAKYSGRFPRFHRDYLEAIAQGVPENDAWENIIANQAAGIAGAAKG